MKMGDGWSLVCGPDSHSRCQVSTAALPLLLVDTGQTPTCPPALLC